MRDSRMKMTAVLLSAVCTLTGCGEALYTLQPEEEAAVVSYAAHAVAKYNTYQQDGEVYVPPAEADTEEADVEDVSSEQDMESTADAAAPADTSDTQSQPEEQSSVTLTDALDLGVITAEYEGNSLCDTYAKSESYAIDAQSGKQLLVLNVNLINQAAQDLHIDILAMTPEFHAVINGDMTVPAQTTILPNDLSTYVQDIKAGATNETVLIFEIPQDIQEISSIQLKITMNGDQYNVDL